MRCESYEEDRAYAILDPTISQGPGLWYESRP